MVSLFRAAKSFKKRVSLEMKRLRKTPQPRDSGDLFPVSTDQLYLPDSSSMKIESPIGDDIITAVTVSATGEGVHTRWIHPEESAPISLQSTILPASPAFSLTLLDSNDEMENRKLTIKIPAPKKRPTIRIPESKLCPSADSPASLVSNGCSDTEVKEKCIITVPASRKRSRSTDDEDAVFVRHTRLRRFAPAPSPAIIIPVKLEDDLIYSGLNMYTDFVVVTTSATGHGMHTRWIYPTDIVSTSASSDTDANHSGWDAEDEASCDSDFVLEKNHKLTITIPPLKNLKRTRNTEDDDCPARRTRSRLSASSSSSSISTLSTTSSTTSSDSSRVRCHGACYSPLRKVVAGKRSSKKSKKN